MLNAMKSVAKSFTENMLHRQELCGLLITDKKDDEKIRDIRTSILKYRATSLGDVMILFADVSELVKANPETTAKFLSILQPLNEHRLLLEKIAQILRDDRLHELQIRQITDLLL